LAKKEDTPTPLAVGVLLEVKNRKEERKKHETCSKGVACNRNHLCVYKVPWDFERRITKMKTNCDEIVNKRGFHFA
jgi:hypothetical protein